MESNRLLRLNFFVLTLGIAFSSVPVTAFDVDLKEPVYKLPVLRSVHDKICEVIGIEDISGSLASLPEKAKSEFGEAGKFIVEPWTKLACSRMRKGFFVGLAADELIIKRYFSDEKFKWAPEWWPLSWKSLVKKCLTHFIVGSTVKDSLVREVLNTLYKHFISESIERFMPESIKKVYVANYVANYAANVYGKYAFNKFGKYAFNQILPQTHKA